MQIPQLLFDKQHRKDSVLILRGTGLGFWYYYPFLSQFSVQQLSDFHQIYGVSGGAACLWFRVLDELMLFDSARAEKYDKALRTLNESSLPARMWRLLTNQYIYNTHDLANGTAIFASPEASSMKFNNFPLSNFTAVAFDDVQAEVLFLNRRSAPDLHMGEVISSVCFPHKLYHRRISRPIDFGGYHITDMDFAARRLKHTLREQLASQHSDRPVYVLNLFKSGSVGNLTFVNLSGKRFRIAVDVSQCLDAVRLFLGLPNRRLSGPMTSLPRCDKLASKVS